MSDISKHYIEPDCQSSNPVDFGDEQGSVIRVPITNYVNDFVKGGKLAVDEKNTLFVLGDAGMGKTSLLVMLKLSHMLSFWPKSIDVKLFKLGTDTLENIKNISRKEETILLLDALDEDPVAWQDVNERINSLLIESKKLYRVIITCRTQFFPLMGNSEICNPGVIKEYRYKCNRVYLSRFSDRQIEEYLNRSNTTLRTGKIKRWLFREKEEYTDEARKVTGLIQTLKTHPMLLAYVDDLMLAGGSEWGKYKIYKELVSSWLLREERKSYKILPKKDKLLNACRIVALHLHMAEKRTISDPELREIIENRPAIDDFEDIDIGGRSLLTRTSEGNFRFSHYSIQEYLVVDALIHAPNLLDDPIRTTDVMMDFINSWVQGNPRERLPLIPWLQLDLHEQYINYRSQVAHHDYSHVMGTDQKRDKLEVFLCHSKGDKEAVRELYRQLISDGFNPWLDEENLMPGQDWELEIKKAVQRSDVVIVCLSRNSVNKSGYVQKEIRHALDVADYHPEGTTFLIPAKLEECESPDRLNRWQRVNLFDDKGYEKLVRALRARDSSK